MTERPRWRPPRAREPRSAAEAVASVIALHDLSDGLRAQRVTTEWTELVGERIATRTRPIGISERMLVIEVATSAWLHELTLLRLQLLTGLVARLGEPRLFDDLRFKLAGRDRPRAPGASTDGGSTVPRRATTPRHPPPPPATGANRERIVREAAAVDDDELRELIARVRVKYDR